MKTVKLMLSAIAIFAVVGGALAFKAQKFSLTKIYTTDNQFVGALCPLEKSVQNYTIVANGTQTFATITSTDSAHPDGYPCETFSTGQE